MALSKLLLGDSLHKLKELPENSIDAVVTDPPYGLSFMGKHWDYDVPTVELWREVLRVLKPGGHVLSFGGTRTYHRMVVNIEDAGFEIRDQVQWLYGSGFPKSLNVGKAIDKMNGVELEVVGKGRSGSSSRAYQSEEKSTAGEYLETKSNNEWQGFGTALKPANEPICLARKPLEKGLTVAENVLKWGCGAINVDGCRIDIKGDRRSPAGADGKIHRTTGNTYSEATNGETFDLTQGRWPANLLLDETAAESLGEPSRFFYVAKASKRERNAGLEGMPEKESGIKNDSGRGFSESDPYKKITNQNHHPTVKPIKLMEYLITLITPPNGTVLDPFMGSGSTGVAAKNLGFQFTGIELNEEYFEIAKKRIVGETP